MVVCIGHDHILDIVGRDFWLFFFFFLLSINNYDVLLSRFGLAERLNKFPKTPCFSSRISHVWVVMEILSSHGVVTAGLGLGRSYHLGQHTHPPSHLINRNLPFCFPIYPAA